MSQAHAIIVLIDGECVMCNRVARFLIRRDRDGLMKFAALGSRAANRELDARGLPPPPQGTFVLIINNQAFYRSEAAIRVLSLLPAPWCWAAAAGIIPRPLRDAGYAFIAAVRYRLLGRVPSCSLLTETERARFLNDDE